MAKENSILMLQGNIGNFSFYKTKDGSMVRMKGGVERSKIFNDPKFARTRENMNEFGIVAQTGKVIRGSLSNYVRKISDSKASNRMTSVLTKIKHLDEAAVRGERTPSAGISTPEGKLLLESFDFNANSQLKTLLTVPLQIDETTGMLTVENFSPKSSLILPKEATHVQIGIAIAALDGDLKTSETIYSPLMNSSADAVPATLSLDPGASIPNGAVKIFAVLIEFLQEINGVQYPLNNNQFNCLNIVKVT
ncbi:hypothetical protein [uncultured Chryseobacterium sp.]|uniref:hypothetical protein n=1 Tax=uncultured Chryseobacterium sp. TaxID=259322 RepID=UPI0026256DE6|nr:hypothetical protein [uncultured Chryseobacterium sp.]